MARHVGKKVKVKVAHPAAPKGMKGRISEVHATHTGAVFYGISTGGGMAYIPAEHAEVEDEAPGAPESEPDADDSGGGGGQMSTTLAGLSPEALKNLGNR